VRFTPVMFNKMNGNRCCWTDLKRLSYSMSFSFSGFPYPARAWQKQILNYLFSLVINDLLIIVLAVILPGKHRRSEKRFKLSCITVPDPPCYLSILIIDLTLFICSPSENLSLLAESSYLLIQYSGRFNHIIIPQNSLSVKAPTCQKKTSYCILSYLSLQI